MEIAPDCHADMIRKLQSGVDKTAAFAAAKPTFSETNHAAIDLRVERRCCGHHRVCTPRSIIEVWFAQYGTCASDK
jgi:hypothetical protein